MVSELSVGEGQVNGRFPGARDAPGLLAMRRAVLAAGMRKKRSVGIVKVNANRPLSPIPSANDYEEMLRVEVEHE